MSVKVIARRNPQTPVELAEYLGYPVLSWVICATGDMVIDLDVDSLTPGEKVVLGNKIAALGSHFDFAWK